MLIETCKEWEAAVDVDRSQGRVLGHDGLQHVEWGTHE